MAEKNPIVTLEVADYEPIKIELYPEIAPNTVNNFIFLVNQGFYNGLTFHRIIKGFMIQGGCPTETVPADHDYSIKGEFSGNGFKNDLKHTAGVISMARSMMPDSAGSQFFIMHKDAPHLDGQYAAFGKVIEGLDVVDLNCLCRYRLWRYAIDTDCHDKSQRRHFWRRIYRNRLSFKK